VFLHAGKNQTEGSIFMSTFEDFILNVIFCFVILENEVNSLIVTFLLLANFTAEQKR